MSDHQPPGELPDLGWGPGTALVVVDVQNDFADPAGGLAVAGGEQVVSECAALLRAAHAAGSPVVLTQDWHPGETPHFERFGGVWPVHCVAGTWGAQLHPGLPLAEVGVDPDADDAPVVRKGVDGGDGYSGFSVRDPSTGKESATALERLLRERDVARVVVAGLAGDVCVKETALDAVRLGLTTVVPLAATRFVADDPTAWRDVVDELTAAGVDVRGALPPAPASAV